MTSTATITSNFFVSENGVVTYTCYWEYFHHICSSYDLLFWNGARTGQADGQLDFIIWPPEMEGCMKISNKTFAVLQTVCCVKKHTNLRL